MNTYRFPHTVATFNTETRVAFREALLELKRPDAVNKLHLHEQPFGEHTPDSHDLNGCYDFNQTDINISNPRLFSGTYMHDGVLYVAWGFVAFETNKAAVS